MLGITTWYRALEERLSAHAEASWGERLRAFRERVWGLLLIVIVHRRHLHRHLHADRSRRDERGLRLHRRGVRLQGHEAKDVPKVLLDSANMSAMLLYIITNAVLFSFLMTTSNIPQAMAEWIIGKGLGWIAFLLVVNVLLLLAGNVMEPSSIVLIMAPILFPVAIRLGIDPIHFGILIDGEHGGRHVPPAGRAQSLRRLGHHQDGHHRAHRSRSGRGS